MTALEIIDLLARMTTPDDEWLRGDTGYVTAEDYTDDLSSDRLEDDARALWRLIDEARVVKRRLDALARGAAA